MLWDFVSLVIESRTDDLKQKYPRDAELIDRLSDSDPSNSKKYLSWMFKQARSGARLEDIVPSVQFFHRNEQRFEKRDIGSYESLRELEDAVKSLGDVSKTRERALAKSETEKIQETDDFVVLRIDSREAAQQYGKGTKWCITMRDASYYEQYVGSNVVFYYILRKKLQDNKFDKVAIAIQRDAKNEISNIEFFDTKDKKRKKNKILSLFTILDLEKISRDAASRPKAFLAKLRSGDDFDDRELVDYWKTLGTGHDSEQAKFGFSAAIPRNKAKVLQQIDPKWAKYIAGEETKLEFEDSTRYFKNQIQHRTDGPAVEWKSGKREWWIDGERHREDGPAIEWPDCNKEWWVNGKHHRINGPAIERASGEKRWYVNDILYRTDGPAIIGADGTKYWYANNNLIQKKDLTKYFSDDVLRKYGEI